MHKKYGLNEDSSKYGMDNVTEWRDKREVTQSNKNKLSAVNLKDISTADQNKPDKYVYLKGSVKVNPVYSGLSRFSLIRHRFIR